ncbi:hypothetical protein PG984_005738 [Apiospora sp. TS-2023a]
MAHFFTAAEQRAIRRYRRHSWRSGASEQAKRHALSVALSRLPNRRRHTFLDEIQQGPNRRSSAPAASSSEPILISDDKDGDDDDTAVASTVETNAADKGGNSDHDNNNNELPNDLCLSVADVDAEVDDDKDVDLAIKLEAELVASESPVLAAAAPPPMPPPPPPRKQTVKKRRRKRTIAEVLGVKFVDEEKLHAEFESLVAESRMRTGITGTLPTAPEPVSGGEPAAEMSHMDSSSVVVASAFRSSIDEEGEGIRDKAG